MARTPDEKLDLILDVLRANGLHGSQCDLRRGVLFKAEGDRVVGVDHPQCDCWLSQPDDYPSLPEHDLIVSVTGPAVPVDRERPETWPWVRVVHRPTGLAAEAAGVSVIQAKGEALQELYRLHWNLQQPIEIQSEES